MAAKQKEVKVILIGGYKGVGKNTFANSFQNKNDIRWHLLTRKGAAVLGETFKREPFFESSFARSLKETVCERLSIATADVEELKEVSLTPTQLQAQQSWWHASRHSKSRATLRDVLIDEAAFQRAHNPDIYALTECGHLSIYAPQDAVCLITDWRYPNEEDVVKEWFGTDNVVTVRVIRDTYIRSDSPSEHSLDDVSPDYLAVPFGTCVLRTFNGETYSLI